MDTHATILYLSEEELVTLEKRIHTLHIDDNLMHGKGWFLMSQQQFIQPQIILLKEGTDTSQGKGQLLSNIGACVAVVDMIRTTLGPRGMDKLIVDSKGKVTISNDGATIMKQLDIAHPAAKALVDIARAQDAEVGDGTTSVVLFAGELLTQVRGLVEDGMAPRHIIRGLRWGCEIALGRLEKLAVNFEKEDVRSMLERCASTALSSKIVHGHKTFFTKMIVDAVLMERELGGSMGLGGAIAMKRVAGGALQDSKLIRGVAFKKTFSYAGFEQQPKSFEEPLVLLLNIELELRAERDNAEIRLDKVSEYQAVVEAEWSLLFEKLERIVSTGAKVVLSRLPVGDVATQYFADRGVFCAGRVPAEDLARVAVAVGAAIQSTTNGLSNESLGRCFRFEEAQVGSERYNFFEIYGSILGHGKENDIGNEKIVKGKRTETSKFGGTCTIILRGGSEQYLAEVERSLHDAVMVVRRAVSSQRVVAGGGAVELAMSRTVREAARAIPGRMQRIVQAFAIALEVIPRQLCFNAGLDAVDVMTRLRKIHAQNEESNQNHGVDIILDGPGDMFEAYVWEPLQVKSNMLCAATEAATLILSIDETIRAPRPVEK